MYQTLLVIQYISIVILMLNIVYILNMKQGTIQRDLLFLHFGMLVTIMAYTAEIQAATAEIMKLCIKFSYIGKPIIILSVFLLAADYCKVEIPDLVRRIMVSVQMAVILIVYTFEKHQLFYTYTEYTEEGMFPHLIKGHGVIYNAYTVLIVGYGIAAVIIYIVYAMRTKNIHEKRLCIGLSAVTFFPFVGFAFYLSGLSGGYDCTITGYAIATMFLAILFRNFDVFETVNLATDKVIRYLNAGLIVYDEHDSLIHINNKAKRMRIADQAEQLYKSREYFQFEDNYYRVEKFEIEHDGEYFGYAYYVDNETNNYKYAERLREEIQRADKANIAKSRYLSSMSHDIRTPMNSILGLSHLAKLHIDDKDRVMECLDKIDTSGNQLLELVNEVLDVNKNESEMMEINEGVFDLKALLDDFVIISKPLMDTYKHSFIVDYKSVKDSYVRGDKSRFSHILINLICNFVKYTNDGSDIELVVDETENGESLSTFSFVLKDNGIGISRECLDALFESYKGQINCADAKYETGIGLVVAKHFVELMGGSITSDSTPGAGTEFCFSMPFKKSNSNDVNGNSTSGNQLDLKTLAFAGKRVLLVEDNEMCAEMAGEMLSMIGLSVDYAVDGKDAVEKFREASDKIYDAVLMDIQMPRLNGYEATREIRSMDVQYAKNVPIIGMSGKGLYEDVKESKDAGMNDQITKPLDYLKLYGVLDYYFQQNK